MKATTKPKQASSYFSGEELRQIPRWFLLAGFLFRRVVLYTRAGPIPNEEEKQEEEEEEKQENEEETSEVYTSTTS